MKHGKELEEAKVTTLANLKLVEELLNEKKFFSGESYGFLDLVFGWLADCSGPLEVVGKLKILDENSFPKICEWRNRFLHSLPKTKNWLDQESQVVAYQKFKESKEGK